jgi:CRISPR/Cas system-associated exonuclease Cas4 (RecB family)
MQRLALPTTLSHSSVTLFQACPLRWFFHNVMDLPEETISSSLVFGSAVHSALQLHFSELLAGNPPPNLDRLWEVFWDSWHEHDDKIVLFNKGEDIRSISQLAQAMFYAFQHSTFAHPTSTIIAVEEEIRAKLIPDLPEFVGRLDLVVESSEAYVINDFKTARRPWSEAHVAGSASQLLLYHELVKSWGDDKPVRLAFAVLTKTRSPQLVIHPVSADQGQIERTRRVIERVWQAIESGNIYPNPSPANCHSCPYRQPCRAWAG